MGAKMLIIPEEIVEILRPFARVFSNRIWDTVQFLIIGAILTPGKRTVSAVLRTMGEQDDKNYQRYHRVLNRAKWSGLAASQILLGLLVAAFCAGGVPLIIGVDETIERRKGERIKAKGVFRDAVRSSKKYVVKCFGLRWVSMMLIVPVPWSDRVWALPFMTVLAPSAKTNQKNGMRHKTSVDWIGQMIGVVQRWQPKSFIVLVTDGGLAAIKLGLQCRNFPNPVAYVSRLRLDARLYSWPGPQPKGKRGPQPKKGQRELSLQQRLNDPHTQWHRITIRWYGGILKSIDLISGTSLWHTDGFDPLPIRWVLVRDPDGKFQSTAFFCTMLSVSPRQILTWFIMRWSLEVTFQEARSHLGLETQRQWNDLAIARTTPVLLALFSLISLITLRLTTDHNYTLLPRQSAWYVKQQPTFSDVIAFVRLFLWQHLKFPDSPANTGLGLFPHPLFRGLVDALCYLP